MPSIAPVNRSSASAANLALALALVLAPLSALAQTPAAVQPAAPESAAESDSARLEALDEKVRILERKLEVKDEVEAAKTADAPKITANQDGFILKSADDKFSLRSRALLQVDYRAFLDGIDTGSQRVYVGPYPDNFPSTFVLRKVRPYFDVTLGKVASFRIMPDFGGGTTTLLDAYGELAFRPEARLRVGKFTAPLGLERIQSSADNFFVEYALTSNLSSSRDIGALLTGDLFNESYSYAIGVFNGAVEGAGKDNDSTTHKEIVGRVFALPFKTGNIEALRNLGIGVAGSWGKRWGDTTNTSLPVYRSPGQNPFFNYRTGSSATIAQARGTHYSLIPQGYWFVGSIGLLGEYAFASQQVNTRSLPAVTTLESRAWFATAAYVVTGEQPSFKGLKPRHPLAFDGSGLGAIELVARVAQLDADVNNTFPVYADSLRAAREALSFGGGVNWYLSRFVKWALHYEQTRFEGGHRIGSIDRDDEKVLTTRMQFTY